MTKAHLSILKFHFALNLVGLGGNGRFTLAVREALAAMVRGSLIFKYLIRLNLD